MSAVSAEEPLGGRRGAAFGSASSVDTRYALRSNPVPASPYLALQRLLPQTATACRSMKLLLEGSGGVRRRAWAPLPSASRRTTTGAGYPAWANGAKSREPHKYSRGRCARQLVGAANRQPNARRVSACIAPRPKDAPSIASRCRATPDPAPRAARARDVGARAGARPPAHRDRLQGRRRRRRGRRGLPGRLRAHRAGPPLAPSWTARRSSASTAWRPSSASGPTTTRTSSPASASPAASASSSARASRR
jgi:hypothetical protein